MQITLHVHLQRGEALPAADSNGLSDPYCILRLNGDQKQKSETIYKTLNPEWNQDFYFVEKPGGANQKLLQIEVYDRDSMSADKLGVVELDYSALEVNTPTQYELDLVYAKYPKNGRVYVTLTRKQETAGETAAKRRDSQVKSTSGLGVGAMFNAVKQKTTKAITSKLTHHQNGGKGSKRLITIDVVQARGIPVMDALTKSADPYAVLKLGKKKRTTKIKFHTLAPQWKERFVFTLFDMGGRDSSTLELSLWDKDTVGMDDKIGTLKVDLTQLPLGQTDERFWKCQRYESKSGLFGFGGGKPAAENSNELPDIEILLLITVADLFEPAMTADELAQAQKLSRGWLKTCVHQARDLGAFDANGKSDPFVVVELGNKHARTHTVKANLNPEWESVLEMPVTEVFDEVLIRVFDEDDNGRFELMGSLVIPLLHIENGKRKWYQLKDASLLRPAQGCIQLSFNLNYLKLPMLAKCIGRRPPKYLVQDEEFKLSVLKSHIQRLSAVGKLGLEGAILGNKAMTWELGPPVTVGFTVGWILFWTFCQLWHLTFAALLALLSLGMLKFRGKRGTGFQVGEEEGDEENDAEESDGDEPAAKPVPTTKNTQSMLSQMHQLKSIAKLVQNLLGDLASGVERVGNLCTWERPILTAITCLGLWIGTLVLFFVPIRFLIMAVGLNRIVMKGLRKYHPKFKRGMYHIPYYPPIEFIGRVPDNLELEQQRLLELPEGLD